MLGTGAGAALASAAAAGVEAASAAAVAVAVAAAGALAAASVPSACAGCSASGSKVATPTSQVASTLAMSLRMGRSEDMKGSLNGLVVGFAGADAHGLFNGHDKNLAVANLARARGLANGLDNRVSLLGWHRHLNLDLGQKVHHVLGAAVQLGVTFLSPKALDLGDRKPSNAKRHQRLAHLVEFERFDDCA